MVKRPCLLVEHELHDTSQTHVYRLDGKLIGESVCYDFLESVREAIDKNAPNVVIDARKLEWANSSGVGILAAVYTSARKLDGRVCLAGMGKRLAAVIAASGLDSYLRPCGTVEEALLCGRT